MTCCGVIPMSSGKGNAGARHYLRSLHIDAFGGMSQRDVGPFTPGLNVVFGENEAGKTTTAAFVGGVLFGWDEARGKRNVYRPANAERSGTLVFRRRDGAEGNVRLSRARNAEGLRGDEDANLLEDIDKETFKTVFSLNSDELRRLGKTSDVTARLLTAGAGTRISPTQALAEIERRLAACLSRSASHPDSIPNCKAQLDEVRAKLAESRREAEQFCNEDREFKELEPRMRELEEALDASNRSIELLSVQRDAVEKLEAQEHELQEREADLDAEEAEIEALLDAHWERRDERLPRIDAVEERSIRESIDELAEERNRLESVVSLAKREHAASKAFYEALQETDDIKDLTRREARQRRLLLVFSLVVPFFLALAGVPLFLYGRTAGSLSMMVMGAAVVLVAVFMALSGVGVLLFRPMQQGEDAKKRLADAHWVMLQDAKKLEAMTAELEEHDAEISRYLDSVGLQAASGSLRRARVLLDAASQDRADWSVLDQRRQSLTAQRVVLEDQRRRAKAEREAAFGAVGLDAGSHVEAIDELLRSKQRQREAQQHTSASYHARYGELKQELSRARRMRTFDELKLQEQMIRTRLDDTTEEYARLLLAKRILSAAIASWGSESQPRVYRRASRLMSIMTGGRWVQVEIGDGGELRVADEFGMAREPSLLSMGTCQQLYLALRIALLETAENVGTHIPVLADDILVNFDDQRRRGAAAALVDLARRRQVIIFTCHAEVVRLMQESSSDVNVIAL